MAHIRIEDGGGVPHRYRHLPVSGLPVLGAPLGVSIHNCGRTPTREALLIRIGRIVLELIVEADVVHLLEHVVLVSRTFDRSLATTAQKDVGVRHHGAIMADQRPRDRYSRGNRRPTTMSRRGSRAWGRRTRATEQKCRISTAGHAPER